jgi:hypothetical protein
MVIFRQEIVMIGDSITEFLSGVDAPGQPGVPRVPGALKVRLISAFDDIIYLHLISTLVIYDQHVSTTTPAACLLTVSWDSGVEQLGSLET